MLNCVFFFFLQSKNAFTAQINIFKHFFGLPKTIACGSIHPSIHPSINRASNPFIHPSTYHKQVCEAYLFYIHKNEIRSLTSLLCPLRLKLTLCGVCLSLLQWLEVKVTPTTPLPFPVASHPSSQYLLLHTGLSLSLLGTRPFQDRHRMLESLQRMGPCSRAASIPTE